MSSKLKKYTVHWKDFNSPLSRNELMPSWGRLWKTEYGISPVVFGIISRKNSVDYFIDLADLEKAQKDLYDRMMDNPKSIEDLIWKSESYARELNEYTESLHRSDLSSWSVEKLEKAYSRFYELQKRQYGIGTLLVGMDTAAGPLSLESAIWQILSKRRLLEAVAKDAYAVFTSPAFETFSRRQEKDLLKIYHELFRHPRIFKEFSNHPSERLLEFLHENNPRLLKKITRHTAKWAWVYYAFAGPAWTEHEFLASMKDWARRKIRPDAQATQWKKEAEEIRQKKRRYFTLLKLTPIERGILRLGGLVVWAKPHRKDHQTKSYWHMEHVFREVARRLFISVREARSLPRAMLFQALRKGKADPKKIDAYYQLHLTIDGPKGMRVFTGKQALLFIKKNIKEKKLSVRGTQFTGSSASPGMARGFVKIINSSEEIEKMREGDILVSVATNPSIVPAMRRASAILTDEGGLTCHAAIVSRELGIPCVVGLHVITSAIKDGDRVAVDATKGIVRILK